MTRVTFLLSKDPIAERGGDLDTSRVVMGLAATAFEVSAICLSSSSPGTSTVDIVPGGLALTRVPKPAYVRRQLLVDSIRTRRSIVHVRFDLEPLLPAIEASDADVFVAEHSYMAETFMRSRHFGTKGLVVNTINTESGVWRSTRGLLGRLEWRRILRDELRVAGAAHAVGVYDREEADLYRQHGVHARWLDVTRPPVTRLEVSTTPPRLVHLGRRDWPPNQEGFLEALRLWPAISAGIPGAELCIVGLKKPGATDPRLPPGVRDLGFVDDLDEFLGTCRALVAPIRTGGGVRAKLLDAASRGLPVVATTPAIGSLGPLFGLAAHDSDEDFIRQCRLLLQDRAAACAAGSRLYELNERHWASGKPRRGIEGLVRLAETRFGHGR